MAFRLIALEEAARSGADAIMQVLADLRGELADGDWALVEQIARANLTTWLRHPEVAAADFYARTLELRTLDSARLRWQAELDARGPWLRALRAIPTRGGPIASLGGDAELRFGHRCARFESENCIAFESSPTLRFAWHWSEGRVERESVGSSTVGESYPRFEPGGEAPLLRRTPESEPVALPWPDFGHANAHLSDDGRRIYVYGWYEDYAGLLHVLDAQSLTIERSHEFPSPVSRVIERGDADELLVSTYRRVMILAASGERRWELDLAANEIAWSPSGRFVCTIDTVARVWDRHARLEAERSKGLRPTFSPDGSRLVDGSELLDGHRGARIATLALQFGNYLEGGPASPWYHVGNTLIVVAHSRLGLWRTSTGEPVKAEIGSSDSRLPHWHLVAFDASGCLRARANEGERQVVLVELVTGRTLATIEFETAALTLALSPDGQAIAVAGPGRVEVRRRDGKRVFVGDGVPTSEVAFLRGRASLEFSADGHTLYFAAKTLDQSRAWQLVRIPGSSPAKTLAPDSPPGWTIEPGAITNFVRSDGVRLALPYEGPWAVNPRTPNLLACPGGLFELRG